MKENKVDAIETILKTYSVVSEKEDEILWLALMKIPPGDVLENSEKANLFLEQFYSEKSFDKILVEAISNELTNIDKLSEEIAISKSILEKVLNHAALPNIIPIKKMKALLHLLHIPITRAVQGIRASMGRFNVEDSFVSFSSVAMSRSRRKPFDIASASTSRESLKRGLEAYIKRLTDEDK
ncbi:MAG: hypothetical protein GTN82_43045 [Candidatus Aminicenantes bacterium]|nr:hypothetical protein [Candidatus Aminicenantes bacterium]NIN23556.1 hypothetical protein [Candidatus Aminicenantes bacterium]NIR12227.1 hypothetical protein [Candidatus Aminicenantes bacterium]